MEKQTVGSLTRELFRYANVRAPRILDLEARLKTFAEGRELLKKSGKTKLQSAQEIVKSGSYIDSVKKLSFKYLELIDMADVPDDYLPSGKSLVDRKKFKAAVSENGEKIRDDLQKVTLSLYAAVSLGKEEETGRLSRLLQFIEAYPTLDKRVRRVRYAPVVTKRYTKIDGKAGEVAAGPADDIAGTGDEARQESLSSRHVLMLWDAANSYRKEKLKSLSAEIEEVNRRKFIYPEAAATRGQFPTHQTTQSPAQQSGQSPTGQSGQNPAQQTAPSTKKRSTPFTAQQGSKPASKKTGPAPQADKSPEGQAGAVQADNQSGATDSGRKDSRRDPEAAEETRRQFREFAEKKKQELSVLKKEKESLKSREGFEIITGMLGDKDYLEKTPELKGLPGKSATTAGKAFNEFREKYSGFHELYEHTVRRETESVSFRQKCEPEINDPCYRLFINDRHKIKARDQVRPLGEADLIVVEESWLKYTPGEIVAVESVLKNEKRVKIVKTETTFEDTYETSSEEISETESESKSTISNELSSQVENEISSRFKSDINSSVKGAGGGTIGVVNFKGEGSVGSKVEIGMDTKFASTESSEFSSEIIGRAVEKTKRTTTERRLSKTTRRYETNHTHEIDNTGSNSGHINGIYCYLDKHICITERQYGIRQFLIADVYFPGREIMSREMQRHVLNLNEVGLPPVFDIGPEDIDEDNYLTLAGRYRAFAVPTPPPVVKFASRTYKTDTSNENKVQNESKIKDVVDILAPFFGQYKRYLIQDNIEIPEGYIVQEVHVTVTHGANGVSIPAHLPFTLGGALVYAMPKLAISAIPIYTLLYLPIALYEIVYLASPVLHYNADSSNCTVNIGHETQESAYFFFQPDDLLLKITNLAAGFPQLSDNVVTQINAVLNQFLTDMPAAMQQELVEGFQGAFNDVVGKIRELTDIIRLIAKPVFEPGIPPLTDDEVGQITGFFTTGFQDFKNALKNSGINISTLLEPLNDLIEALKEIIETELLQSFFDELQSFFAIIENSDTLVFSGMKGVVNSLPVSLNCIALKPGVTVNLTATMVRAGNSSLDGWRMEAFERLNQAYYQMEAEYQSRLLVKKQDDFRRSPGIMRNEEERVIKDRVIRSLHNLHPSSQGNGLISPDHYKLFEHAIDWDNISYRLYNYGPKASELVFEKMGLYKGADERRKAFMNALWAQVLIPLHEDEMLESFMMGYIHTGEVKTLDELIDAGAMPDGEIDEIAAIYRDIILRRQQIAEEPAETYRHEIIPTELMIIYEGSDELDMPENEAAQARCSPPDTE